MGGGYSLQDDDASIVLKFLKENIFARFGVPKDIISDECPRFFNCQFDEEVWGNA